MFFKKKKVNEVVVKCEYNMIKINYGYPFNTPISDSRNSAFLARGDQPPNPLPLRRGGVNGSELIAASIKDELGIVDGETTDDGLFSLKHVACLGCCSLSPVMMINGETYGSLTPDKTKTILRELAAKAGDNA